MGRARIREPFTVAQARAAGLSEWEIGHGAWRIPHQGVRSAWPAPDARDVVTRCRELMPVLPAGARFCRSTAIDLYGVDRPRGLYRVDALHVQVPRTAARVRRPGVVTHTTQAAGTLRVRHGCPVLAPERLWIDLAGELTVGELVVLGDALLRRARPVTRVELLGQALERVPPGTRGLRRLRAALPLIRPQTDSCQETRLRLILHEAGLPEPEVNRPARSDAGTFLALPDLSYPRRRIAIEYDGDLHRVDPRTWSRDVARRRSLTAHGWLISTWTAADLRSPASALLDLRTLLAHRGATT